DEEEEKEERGRRCRGSCRRFGRRWRRREEGRGEKARGQEEIASGRIGRVYSNQAPGKHELSWGLFVVRVAASLLLKHAAIRLGRPGAGIFDANSRRPRHPAARNHDASILDP